MEGWICLYRKVKEHWLWEPKRKFSKFEAWVDILLSANHSEAKVLLGNEVIILKKGEFITSLRKLSTTWNWSVTKVEAFLKILKNEKMLSYKKDTKKTVISVEKWDFYQVEEIQKKTQKEHKKDTKRKQKETNNNDNNVNNETNNNYNNTREEIFLKALRGEKDDN